MSNYSALKSAVANAQEAERHAAAVAREVAAALLAEIEDIPEAEGYQKLSDHPRCFTMSLSAIANHPIHSLDVRFYDLNYQRERIRERFDQGESVGKILETIDRLVDEKRLHWRGEDIPLYPSVIEKLEEIRKNL